MALYDFSSVLQILYKIEPDEVYNLAGQSSVGLSFQLPVETLESIATGTLNLLEAIRFSGAPIKFYNAGSSECFGDIGTTPADELTPFRPRSPYAVAKSAAFWEVANYREAYGIFACSGILFNHESPLRPQRFVTHQLQIGNVKIKRDWGWAPEYVQAMHLMLQQSQADDYVIATGNSSSLEEFVIETFHCLGLNWQDYVSSGPNLFRPTDISYSCGNPGKAEKKLDWKAQYKMPEVVKMMVENRLKHQKG